MTSGKTDKKFCSAKRSSENADLAKRSKKDRGHDSLGLVSKKARILQCINNAAEEITPLEIHEKTMINHSTVKNYCRRLLAEERINQSRHGSYEKLPTHGVGFDPLTTHNIVLSVMAPWLDFSDEVVEWTGSVKLRVQFGIKRKKITGSISCDEGMDKNATMFALHRFFDVVKERSGHDVEKVVFKTFEVNKDAYGVRLDGGWKCFTKKRLFDVIECIYQKDEGVVRAELKINRDLDLENFQALIMGGMAGYDENQRTVYLGKKIERLIEIFTRYAIIMRDRFKDLEKKLEEKPSEVHQEYTPGAILGERKSRVPVPQ